MTMMTSIEVAQEKLARGMKELLHSDAWRSFLRFERAFHAYSWQNRLLLWMQNDQATYVAGFHTWRKLGRHVKRGEHGLMILAPLVGRAIESSTGRDEADGLRPMTQGEASEASVSDAAKDKRLYGFRTVTVFDVSQTQGQPLPELPIQPLRGKSLWYERLCEVCPFSILEVDDLGGANGTYCVSTGQIEIVRSLDSLHKAKTLVHEWAHGLLHSDGDGRTRSREVKELEAESVAFVVCDALGIDTSAYSFGYLASWNGKEAMARMAVCGPRISEASDAVLRTLWGDVICSEARSERVEGLASGN